MTASQYDRNRETLAFRLAIHAAFGNTLVIVGMSLKDPHLQQQIESSRASLADVYWFDCDFPGPMSSWARSNRITTVGVDWSGFWDLWRELPVSIARSDLCAAWYLAVNEAADEASGGSLSDLKRSLTNLPQGRIPPDLTALAERMALAGASLGEPGEVRSVSGQHPRAIELAVRKRMQDENIPTPTISKTYDPGVT
jgi:hypothetical protein